MEFLLEGEILAMETDFISAISRAECEGHVPVCVGRRKSSLKYGHCSTMKALSWGAT